MMHSPLFGPAEAARHQQTRQCLTRAWPNWFWGPPPPPPRGVVDGRRTGRTSASWQSHHQPPWRSRLNKKPPDVRHPAERLQGW